MNFRQHLDTWKNCDRCPLHRTRRRTVLCGGCSSATGYRNGSVPAQVVFVGEAPGVSEDSTGKPFIGPAGKLLGQIIEAAEVSSFLTVNTVACVPLDKTRQKTKAPPKVAVETCSERVNQLIKLVGPKLIVWVGKEARQAGEKLYEYDCSTVEIIHPAAILRMSQAQKGLAAQRCVVALRDALEDL